MTPPTAAEYNEAMQNLHVVSGDDELRGGQVVCNRLGLPMPYAGNFADVYQVRCARRTVAVKCFKTNAPGLRHRYREISTHLRRARLGFMVDFDFVEQGLRLGGTWQPVLKMDWVEGGIGLNSFVHQYADHAQALRALLALWMRVADRLQQAEVTHSDLQHGNVLLVPVAGTGQLTLKLVDYDGMYVPSLANQRSGEIGHPCYQHPQRLRDGTYGPDVDRFSHLVIYSAISIIAAAGRPLWERFNNQENLLFREADFATPHESEVFRELWTLRDRNARSLVGHLLLSTKIPLSRVPRLNDLIRGEDVRPLTSAEEQQVSSILHAGRSVVPVPVTQAVPWWDSSGRHELEPELGADSVSFPNSPSSTGTAPVRNSPAQGTRPDPRSPVKIDIRTTPRPLTRKRTFKSKLSTWRIPPVLKWVVHLDDWLARTAGPNNRIAHNVLRVQVIFVPLIVITIIAVEFTRSPLPRPSNGESSEERALSGQASFDRTPPPLALAPFDSGEAFRKQEAWASYLGAPIEVTNSVGMKLRLIPPGEFLMGSAMDEPGRSSNETPRRVRLTRPFYLGVCAVTQGEYQDVMGTNPSHHVSASIQDPRRLPVEQVTWHDAVEFCERLSALPRELARGREYRLATEAEWEYACRAGTTTPFHFGSHLNGDEANVNGTSPYGATNPGPRVGRTTAVGSYPTNAFGIYDMHGNVWEWCSDWYRAAPDDSADDPRGPSTGALRVFRGGSWLDSASDCRSAIRRGYPPQNRNNNVGFRVVCVSPDEVGGF